MIMWQIISRVGNTLAIVKATTAQAAVLKYRDDTGLSDIKLNDLFEIEDVRDNKIILKK